MNGLGPSLSSAICLTSPMNIDEIICWGKNGHPASNSRNYRFERNLNTPIEGRPGPDPVQTNGVSRL